MVGYVILGAVLIFLAVILIRAAMFNPREEPPISNEEVSFDRDAAVSSLQQLLRCRTVSNVNKELEDEGEFQKLIDLLPQLYPNVFRTCEFQRLPDRALLFKWAGKNPGAPSVMMAHYDFVPVEEELWEILDFCLPI